MGEFLWPSSDTCCPSSFTAGHHDDDDDQVLDLVVLKQWLGDDDDALCGWGDGGSISAAKDQQYAGKSLAPPPVVARRRGRKPGPRTTNGRPAITHVQAERQRRDKLHRRFCELRAAVPTVSRMDRASLLADAARYIAELRGRVEQLEAEQDPALVAPAPTVTTSSSHSLVSGLGVREEELEVRMAGPEAAVLRMTTAARHAPARFMDALRSLDLPVRHACVCCVGGVTVLDALVDVSTAAALRDEGGLRAALLHRLQVS
ncbi:hypothetical protein U9M48_037950 [Paspalum notatum var. saurae]|uniref:Transcription factor n=1 Tax=Paspalum notatum var. saurae TaxID=547442 RepID=A0AAQ3XCY3_PASNO